MGENGLGQNHGTGVKVLALYDVEAGLIPGTTNTLRSPARIISQPGLIPEYCLMSQPIPNWDINDLYHDVSSIQPYSLLHVYFWILLRRQKYQISFCIRKKNNSLHLHFYGQDPKTGVQCVGILLLFCRS